MKITNGTIYALCVSSREFTELIGPGQSATVPDDVAQTWAKRETPKHFIERGLITMGEDDAPVAPTEWRDAVAAVGKIDSLDELEELQADEARPRVRTAIETRMKELRAG